MVDTAQAKAVNPPISMRYLCPPAIIPESTPTNGPPSSPPTKTPITLELAIAP